MAENNIPGVSEQAKKLVDNYNQWINPHVNPHVKLDGPKIPDAPTPQVNTLNESELERKLDEKYNLPQRHIDTTQGRPTDADVKAEGVRLVNEGKARIAEANEKYQADQEAKHRKAEKMWSAIGDGISAIANMATVGAGADSMYNPADSLHSKVKSKWDEIKANKAAIAAANRKAQMDLLLKEYELGVKSKEAEANRNFNIWKTETEEAGRNQRAKTKQEFDAEQNELNRKARIEAAVKGRSGGGGGGSSSTGKYFFNGVAYKSASERNQAILNAAKKYQYDVYDDDDNLRDWDVMAVELEELMAEGELQPQPQPGNYAQRWGSMFGGNSTSVPSAKPSKSSTTKYDPKKDTTSLYN